VTTPLISLPFPDLLRKYHHACQKKPYQKFLCKEKKKDLYINTPAIIATLEQLIDKRFDLRPVVDPPRICRLKTSTDYDRLQHRGTPAVPPPDAQGQLLPLAVTPNGVAETDDGSARLNQLISELDLAWDPT